MKGAVLAIPFAFGVEDALTLNNHPMCRGLVLRNPSSKIIAIINSKKLGFFEDHSWKLPTVRIPIVFIGSPLLLTRQMASQVVKSYRLSIICKVNGRYQKLPIYRFLLWRVVKKLVRSLNQYPEKHLFRKVSETIKKTLFLRILWQRVFISDDRLSGVIHKGGWQNDKGFSKEMLYKELLQCAFRSTQNISYKAIPRRVILVNAGLAAGGAERQIINTLIGLKASGKCESVTLLAEYIDYAQNLNFFLHELETAEIEVSQVEHTISLYDEGLSSVYPEVADLLSQIEPNLAEDILNLVEEFRSRRPEVVHAWQDSTSIKVGIAAIIVGVPRIILASRNVVPMNFTYYQDYMYPAYRALASIESVRFINNSEAGAIDYITWLGLPRERFVIIRNGVDLGNLKRADSKSIREYRQSIGIPENARVIGSIFRFWEEKQPILWLQTAAVVAKHYPDIHFLIIGEGPLRQEMEAFIRINELMDRVHLPGSRSDIAMALSAMNMFMLTSAYEGTPNVVLEAQWLGLPIVATNAGGTREAFVHNVTGLLANSFSAEELAMLVLKLLEEKDISPILGPEFIERTFNIQRMVEDTIKIYEFN